MYKIFGVFIFCTIALFAFDSFTTDNITITTQKPSNDAVVTSNTSAKKAVSSNTNNQDSMNSVKKSNTTQSYNDVPPTTLEQKSIDNLAGFLYEVAQDNTTAVSLKKQDQIVEQIKQVNSASGIYALHKSIVKMPNIIGKKDIEPIASAIRKISLNVVDQHALGSQLKQLYFSQSSNVEAKKYLLETDTPELYKQVFSEISENADYENIELVSDYMKKSSNMSALDFVSLANKLPQEYKDTLQATFTTWLATKGNAKTAYKELQSSNLNDEEQEFLDKAIKAAK